jgi:hypothetical protein
VDGGRRKKKDDQLALSPFIILNLLSLGFIFTFVCTSKKDLSDFIMFFGGDPFGGHGHGGGGGGRGRAPRADVDTTKLYETLGVSSIVG